MQAGQGGACKLGAGVGSPGGGDWRGALPPRKIGHTQIRNDTFPEQASSIWLGRPPSPLFTAPPCSHPLFACAHPVPSAWATHPSPWFTHPALPCPHTPPSAHMPGGAEGTVLPPPVPSTQATPTPPPSLHAPPHPHALPLCHRRDSALASPLCWAMQTLPPGLRSHPTCTPTPSPLHPDYPMATPPGLHTPPCLHALSLCAHVRGAGGQGGRAQRACERARWGATQAEELHMNGRVGTPKRGCER